MKKIFLLGNVLLLSACEIATSTLCYYSEQDQDPFYVIIGSDDLGDFVKILGPNGEDPVLTYGRRENDAFVYADGTKFYLSEEKAWGEAGTLLEGVEAQRHTCPDFL